MRNFARIRFNILSFEVGADCRLIDFDLIHNLNMYVKWHIERARTECSAAHCRSWYDKSKVCKHSRHQWIHWQFMCRSRHDLHFFSLAMRSLIVFFVISKCESNPYCVHVKPAHAGRPTPISYLRPFGLAVYWIIHVITWIRQWQNRHLHKISCTELCGGGCAREETTDLSNYSTMHLLTVLSTQLKLGCAILFFILVHFLFIFTFCSS